MKGIGETEGLGTMRYEGAFPLRPPLDGDRVLLHELFSVNRFWITMVKAGVLAGLIALNASPLIRMLRGGYLDLPVWGIVLMSLLLLVAACYAAWGVIPEMLESLKKSTVGAIWERDVLQPYLRQFPLEQIPILATVEFKAKHNIGYISVGYHVPFKAAADGRKVARSVEPTESGKPELWARLYPSEVVGCYGITDYGCDFIYRQPPDGQISK